jgi:hypothetical protein
MYASWLCRFKSCRGRSIPNSPQRGHNAALAAAGGVIMQISEAARSNAGAMANSWVPAPAPRNRETGRVEGTRRDLDSPAAERVFAAEVLRRVAVVQATRVERSAVETARPQPAQADAVAAVAGALRAAVAAAEPNGGDPVPQLLQDVDAGIASAGRTLERMGYDAKQVAAAAVRFRESVGASLDTPDARQPAAVEGAAVSATHVLKARGSIELVTQDGDVVRIRFRSRDSERVDVAGVQGAQGSALSARIATQHSARLKVAVHGELDAAELKAIEDFLGGVNTLAGEFYGKDAEAAFAAAAAVGADPQEIARYAVKLSLSELYEVRARVQAQVKTQPLPSPTTLPASSATSAGQDSQPPSVGTPVSQPSAPAAQVVDPKSTRVSEQPTAPAQGAEAVNLDAPDAPPAAARFDGGLDTVRQFLQSALAHAHTPVNVHGIALEWSVRIELTAALLEAARPDAHARPGADLLANVLDGAANAAGKMEGASLQAAA